MNKSVFLVFPPQLYPAISVFREANTVVMIEDSLFFGEKGVNDRFHIQKIILHRASMKWYQSWLKSNGIKVNYSEYGTTSLESIFQQYQGQEVHVYEPTDDYLEQRLIGYAEQYACELVWYESPQFITSSQEIDRYLMDRVGKKLFQSHFYQWQRKRLHILLDEYSKPLSGKWSFDTSNRKNLPKKNRPIIPQDQRYDNEYLREAYQYVQGDQFLHCIGELPRQWIFPITREEALQQLTVFIHSKFTLFGQYEDAMTQDSDTVFHSVLSSSLNIGLITPQEVIDRVLERKDEVSIESLEGFIRQIIGWREFVRIVYEEKGRYQRSKNFFGFSRSLSDIWYTGNTGLFPVDQAIQKVNRTGYLHHIERLMIMGNIFLLCEIDPDEVYRWFMELSIDSYDWVMVPNVYGMSQYADGGLMITKPYVSSSRYILSMSDYPKGEWTEVWDGLFWRFVIKHQEIFSKNPRTMIMVKQWDKMGGNKQTQLLEKADEFLCSI